jgi:hypothetical protein
MSAFSGVDLDALWEEKLEHSHKGIPEAGGGGRTTRISEDLFADVDLDAAWREKKRLAKRSGQKPSPGRTHAALSNPASRRSGDGAVGEGGKDATLILKPHTEDKDMTLILDPDAVTGRSPAAPSSSAAAGGGAEKGAPAKKGSPAGSWPALKDSAASRPLTFAPDGEEFDFDDLINAVNPPGAVGADVAADAGPAAGEAGEEGLTADAIIAGLDMDDVVDDRVAGVKAPILDDTAIVRLDAAAEKRLADAGDDAAAGPEIVGMDDGGPAGGESWKNAADTVDLEEDYLPEAESAPETDTVHIAPVAPVPERRRTDVDAAGPSGGGVSGAEPVDDRDATEKTAPGEGSDVDADAPGTEPEAEVAMDPADVFANMGDMDFSGDDGLDDEMRAMLDDGDGIPAEAAAEDGTASPNVSEALPAGRLARARFRLRALFARGGAGGVLRQASRTIAWRENWWFYCDLLAAIIATASLAVIVSYLIWY